MEPGTKVRLTRDVERYPHFTAEAGLTGTVTKFDEEIVAVRLDDPVPGAEEWDNGIHWYKDQFENEYFPEVFREDLEPVSEG